METITFESDEYRLTGTLHLPAVCPAPVVIGCHGLKADRNSPKQIALAEACREKGIGYFRFDHRGCGDSQGAFDRVASLEARRRDLVSAVNLVVSLDACNGVIGLFGSSMGGTVCLSSFGMVGAAAIVTFAAPLHNRFLHSVDSPLEWSFDVTANIGRVKNILVIHGEYDEVVPLSHAEALYKHASRPKKMIIQPGGDHRMSDPGHQSAFVLECVAWYKKCFG